MERPSGQLSNTIIYLLCSSVCDVSMLLFYMCIHCLGIPSLSTHTIARTNRLQVVRERVVCVLEIDKNNYNGIQSENEQMQISQ